MRIDLSPFLIQIFFIKNLMANNWNWNWNNQQPIPNNNVAIGYPTAYGLYAGRGGFANNWYNGGGGGMPPNAGTGYGSPLRCLNGGAHIGQCRLDKDSICIALGGTCTHGACCTTPFVSINGVSTTQKPETIDGETMERVWKTTRRSVERMTTSTLSSIDDDELDTIDSKELKELNKIIETARVTSPTSSEESTTSEFITVTPMVEENENRKCESGLKSIGPCSDDSDCPTLHQCEKQQCCYLLV